MTDRAGHPDAGPESWHDLGMGLLGRKADRSGSSQGDQRDVEEALAAIGVFWTWWSAVREQIETEMVEGVPSPQRSAEITAHVAAIDKGLDWELSRPDTARYQLVVTAGRIGELRSLAHRWAQAAPDHPGWSYLPVRPAVPAALDTTVVVEGARRISPADTEIAARVDQRRAVVDIIVYHPVFADLADAQAREQIVTLILNRLLGEDEVARWIGQIEIATERPLDGIPAGSLPAVMEQVSARYAEPRWALLSGSTATGLPVVATIRFPLHQVDYPLADQHVAVVLPYRDRTEQRLPTATALDALNEFEERLLTITEPGAVLAGHETANGRRIMHVYQDATAPMAAAISDLARGWRPGRASVAVTGDPGWTHIAHLRP
ncbi:MAG TPA: DUF695 domain-containing protein [Actinomycetes bacterium]|nr:DUF695 domain-containing protein [Actinomycetes bacterium]